ncbi:hypothetical protein KFL_007740030 [Klebsormidium nitens]|uniref:Uncharacterized protein n=1 Tax=Klebsormidium nitens TaxID=105231 RepID=A0A1Y1IKI1_KLENI|nr:hypothetical protein KFL_007740030 [Klebsormidium nitens]|eukprot:GAQ91370.1 hypothetical protein KFL_007740030 [Klebsormidium nitens]
MAGGNFFARVVQYVANELIVERLSNHPSFQRWAIRTSKQMEELSKKSADYQQQIAEQARTYAEALKDEVSKAAKDVNKRI